MNLKENEFALIDGTYHANEAKEVLGQLFSYKINFHKLVVHSLHERTAAEKAHSEIRIAELKKERERFEKLMNEWVGQGHYVKVTGNIQVELTHEYYSDTEGNQVIQKEKD